MSIQKTDHASDAFVIVHGSKLSLERSQATRFLLRFYRCLARLRALAIKFRERRVRVRGQARQSLRCRPRNPKQRFPGFVRQSRDAPARPRAPGHGTTNLPPPRPPRSHKTNERPSNNKKHAAAHRDLGTDTNESADSRRSPPSSEDHCRVPLCDHWRTNKYQADGL